MVAPIGDRVLGRIDRGLAQGSIDATLPGGERRILGGHAPGPRAVVRIVHWRALRRLAAGGSAGWYEAWAAGEWTSPDPVVLFELFMLNRRTLGHAARARGLSKLARRTLHWLRRNHRAGARRNVAAHYDLGNDFYETWLDPSRTYSSGLFAEPVLAAQSLESAQQAKLAAILERTAAKPGDTILEIGCGWGSFAAAASAAGIMVHGITLSEEQKAFVDGCGLPGVTVSLTDYRDVSGHYDAVASIEMVEAVGEEFWPAYLRAVAAALRPGGRAAIQLISIDDAIFDAYASSVDFIQRYVFPGGMLISESRFRAISARAGLAWHDRRGFGLHYAETLLRWRAAFDAAVAEARLPARFDANFVAMWRYYLMYCEGGFRGGGIDVAQVTLVKEG
jgi:cyclopropane-fatty-acyl-phospholipid synthase